MKPVGGPVLLSDDQAKRWFKHMIDPGRPTERYRLILDDHGDPVGEISFHHLDPNTMTAMFNLKIAHSERGKGYGREAMLIFLNQFFNELGGKEMLDDIAPDNQRGQELLLRFGFERDRSAESGFMIRMTRDQFNRLYKL
jgi:RimJ/RimL family protein N-acetyltransferase